MSSERNNKNKAMAAHMKEHKIQRTSANCPMCHRLVSLAALPNHIRMACGIVRSGEDRRE